MAEQCCCACMRGGENHAAESTAKKKRTRPHSASGGRAAQSERVGGGNGTEQKGRQGTAAGKKIIATKNRTNNDGWPRGGKARVKGGAGARKRDPPQVQRGTHNASGRGQEGGGQS